MAESVRVPGAMVSLAPTASDDDDEGTSPPRAVVPAEASAGSSCYARKPRGRPPGSKNKPKPPVAVTRACASAMHPVLLQFHGGFDIVSGLSDFVRRHRVGVSVLCATGVVSVVSLRLASFAHGVQGIVTLQGPFDILSLSGTLLPPSDAALPPAAPLPLTVSLASSRGQVIGGAVVGSMPALGPVLLIAATLSSPEFHRLPIDDDDDEAPVEGVDTIHK